MNTENMACEVVDAVISDLEKHKYLIDAWYCDKNKTHKLLVEDRLVELVKAILDENV